MGKSIRTQSGIVLVSSLVFLLVISLLGVNAITGNSLDMRMANSAHDRMLALHAAESALLEIETWFESSAEDGQAHNDLFFVLTNAESEDYPFLYDASDARADWDSYSWTDGTYGVTNPLPNTSQAPRFIIEFIDNAAINGSPNQTANQFIVTVIGYGANPQSRVKIQQQFYYLN